MALNDATTTSPGASRSPRRSGRDLRRQLSNPHAYPVAVGEERRDLTTEVAAGGVAWRRPRQRDLPRMDDDAHTATSALRRVDDRPVVEHNLGESVGARLALPASRTLPVRLATNGSAGFRTSSVAVPLWRSFPSRITPIRSARAAASSKSWVTITVGSLISRRSSWSSARTAVLVWASSGQRLVEEQHGRSPGDRTRERDSAFAAGHVSGPGPFEGRMPKRSSSSSTRAAPPKATFFRTDMREERVVLEQVADRPFLRRPVDPPFGVKPRRLTEIRPRSGRTRPATARSTVVFPHQKAHERDRLAADLEP